MVDVVDELNDELYPWNANVVPWPPGYNPSNWLIPKLIGADYQSVLFDNGIYFPAINGTDGSSDIRCLNSSIEHIKTSYN